jgi:mono/diheme cytochrome c family protein
MNSCARIQQIVIPRNVATRNLLLGFVASTLVAQAAIVILLCSHALGQNPSYQPDYKWHAPAKAAMRPNPLARSPEFSAGGEKIFLRECAECHQHDGSGLAEKHSADLRSPVVQSLSDGALLWKITNGNPRRGMPSFSRLPEKQRWQLVLFLRTLREHEVNSSSQKVSGVP